MLRLAAAVISIMFFSLVSAGCSPVEDTLKLLIGNDKPQTQKPQPKKEPVLEPVENEAGQVQPPVQPQVTAPTVNEGSETIQVTLYFADKEGTGLAKELRWITKVPGLARATLEELIKGPVATSGLSSTIPAGTVLLDLNIKPDGLAIVSFSNEIKANHKGGSTGEALTVNSIVETLAQFPTIKQVQILIDGQAVETLAGHLDLTKPLLPTGSMLKK